MWTFFLKAEVFLFLSFFFWKWLHVDNLCVLEEKQNQAMEKKMPP